MASDTLLCARDRYLAASADRNAAAHEVTRLEAIERARRLSVRMKLRLAEDRYFTAQARYIDAARDLRRAEEKEAAHAS